MTALPLPATLDVSRSVRDLTTGHPELQRRWAALKAWLLAHGFADGILEIEVYRYEARQQWCFGASRVADVIVRYGCPARYARPNDPWLTNAYSAATSAHGVTRRDPVTGLIVPASAAIDCAPVGPDGRPFTKDDPWPEFVAAVKTANLGLRHFTDARGHVKDQDHLQLDEWSDSLHRLRL